MVGQKFCKLLVLEQLQSRGGRRVWKCKCDCGAICEKTTWQLKHSQSCGCLQREQITKRVQKIYHRDRFGFLNVIRKDVTAKTASWVCLCFCGNEVTVRSTNLLSGKTKSCGCMAPGLRNESYYKDRPEMVNSLLKRKRDGHQ